MSQYTASIQQLYVAFFQRPADPTGLAYWEERVQGSNGDLTQVINAFATSTETIATYAGKDSNGKVNTIYKNLFGRDADNDGLIFWSGKLDAGVINLGDIIKAISASASDYDAQIFNGKVKVALNFTNSLDTAAKILAYNGADAGNMAKAYLNNINSINGAAIALARVDSLLADMLHLIDEPMQMGGTFNLTEGIDVFTGTGARDQLNVVGNVLNEGDSIDGGANVDSLNIASTTNSAYTLASKAKVSNIENVNLTAVATVNADINSWQGVRQLNVVAVGDANLQASSSTNITLADNQNNGMININGGHDVTVKASNFAATSIINIGNSQAPTGVVDLKLTGAFTGGDGQVWVHGGSVINIMQESTLNSETNGAADIDILGTDKTSAVYIDQNYVQNVAKVFITDVNRNGNQAGTLKTVDVNGQSSVTIYDNALTNLRIANNHDNNNGGGKITINNAGLINSTNTTLNLALDNTQVAVSDAGVYTTLNLNVNSYNKFTSLQMSGLNNVNLSGYGSVELTAADIPNVGKVTVANAVALTAADLAKIANLTLIDASAGYGNNKVGFDAGHAQYKGGSGNESVIAGGSNIAKAINLGAGDDTLFINTTNALPNALIDGGSGKNTVTLHLSAAASLSKANDFANISRNFQILGVDQLETADGVNVDVAKLGNFDVVKMAGSGSSTTATLSNLKENAAIQLAEPGVGKVVAGNANYLSGTDDHLQIQLGGDLGYTYSAGTVSAQNVENLQVDYVGWIGIRDTGSFSVKIQDDALKSLSGNGRSIVTLENNSTGKVVLDTHLYHGELNWASAAASEIEINSGGLGKFDFSKAQSNANIKITGASALELTIENPVNLVVSTQAGGIVKQLHGNSSVAAVTAVTKGSQFVAFNFAELGRPTFNSHQLIAKDAIGVQGYADAVINAAGDASVNAAGGWFQFGGDTYYVQSQHDASKTAGFVNGTDFIVKVTGLHDMSGAYMSPVGQNLLSLFS